MNTLRIRHRHRTWRAFRTALLPSFMESRGPAMRAKSTAPRSCNPPNARRDSPPSAQAYLS